MRAEETASRSLTGDGTSTKPDLSSASAGDDCQRRLRNRFLGRVLLGRVALSGLVLIVASAIFLLGDSSLAPRAQAQDSTINLVVQDARTGAAIAHFKWMVNLDISHDDASITPPASYSPVVAVGDHSNAAGIVLPNTTPPNRGYLVTVLANDGVGTFVDPDYKIGGQHFRLPDDAGDVTVKLEPNPLPLATIKIRVFHDNHSVTGTDDVPREDGLAGFHVTLADRIGEVTTDWFGNPICTQYETDPGTGELLYDSEGSPIPIPGTGGFCATDATGYVTIPNMGPDRYEVEAIPPDGSDWVQSSTIEGTHASDVWIEEGSQGFGTEKDLLPAPLWFGFVRPCTFGSLADGCTSGTADTVGSGAIMGRVRALSIDTDAPGTVSLGRNVPSPVLALNNLSGDDEQVWTGQGNADGTFVIPNVPPGLYQLVVWDLPQDYIMSFFTVDVAPGQTVDLGDIGIARWFGWIRGSVYIDSNENGVRDPGEPGFPKQDLDTRFKDGAIQYATFADSNGNYEFSEVFELEHFAIGEVGYGRFKNTGAAAYKTDDFGNPIDYPWVNDCTDIDGNPVTPCTPASPQRECTSFDDWRTCEHGPINQDLGLAGLLQSEITWAGLTNYIDWGKNPFAPGENGGIVGIVFSAVTRNELDARFQAAEDYEPGIPGTTVNLYAPALDAGGNPLYDPDTGEILKDRLVNVYLSDSWYDALPTDCFPQGSIGRDPTQVQPYPDIWDKCLEIPALLNQIRPGVFDGGYAFEEDCSNPSPDADDDSDGTPNRFDPDSLAAQCQTLPAGKWVVEVVPPLGHKVVKEEDINVFSGDVFVPQVPPPACVGPLHTVDVTDDPSAASFDPNDPSHTQGVYNPDFLATTSPLSPAGGSPYEGQRMPLCNERLIDLQTGQNANSDFFIFTDVPQPGFLRGLLLDDLTLELNPASPLYAEKRGIPNTPVGVLDFTGREITRLYTDDNGYWEVLLPSTGTYNCPLPAGPCPGLYRTVGNYPGTPDNPEPQFNPNYAPLSLNWDVWPALTTYADVATLPITGFVAFPGTQFQTPPVCNIPTTTPDVQSVSQPYGGASDGGAFSINGAGFGASQGTGSVTLDGISLPVASWSDTAIQVELVQLSLVSAGPHQLLVTNAGGTRSPSGMTFHVLGSGYNPPQRHVGPGQTYATIQAALDAATDGDLILVHPGLYYENIIVDEKVKLQGYGPGASTIDGRFFGFTVNPDDLAAKVAATPYDGPSVVPLGQAVTVLAEDGEFGAEFNAQIDGFTISGGTVAERKATAAIQGGGIYAHAFARYLEVSNNLIQGSAGIAGGGVILGRPYVENPDSGNALNNENDFVRMHHNRVRNNGGALLAGGIALFNGAEGYEIDHNAICGNYSAEYGGGISHFGYSSGSIHDNEILFNYAFDEGGGIIIAGELAQDIGVVSPGSGDVLIARNRIQGNVSNDDGGGIRLLQPVDGAVRIENNMVVNNLATDTGGGMALDDAMRVEIVNNTVAKNISTATAEDADRSTCNPPANGTCAHAAGLVSEPHSAALVAAKGLNCGADACFSNPVLFNNIFWENQAYYLDGTTSIFGGGLPSAGFMDLEVLDGAGHFTGAYNDCTAFTADCPNDGTNISADPLFMQQVTTAFTAMAFAGDPSFITVLIQSTPDDPQGDYHIQDASPAIDRGTAAFGGGAAPTDDFDGDLRIYVVGPEVGADEIVDGEGPPTINVSASPNPTNGATSVTLTGTVDDTTTGNSNIAAAEYFIDSLGADGAGTAMLATDGTFDSPVEGVTASLDISALPDGAHNLYAHGQDAAGNWGAASATVLTKSSVPPPPSCGGLPVTIFGTAGNNVIAGTPGPDVIDGLGGNDTITGLDGDDVICGGDGNDKLNGGNGNDRLYGGSGNDTMKGGTGLDSLYGEAGNDTLDGEKDNDTLDGGAGADTMVGGAGTDTLNGGTENDTLKGGDHDDSLFGDAGDDRLDGGGGTDSCDGGDGADTGLKCETLVNIP